MQDAGAGKEKKGEAQEKMDIQHPKIHEGIQYDRRDGRKSSKCMVH